MASAQIGRASRTMARSKAKCVLVVEDDNVLSYLLKERLLQVGYFVLDVPRVDEALRLLQTEVVHAAILDIHIGSERVFPVAAQLELKQIPYFFASGAADAEIPHEYAARLRLQKPYLMNRVIELLNRLLEPSSGGDPV